ncbi:hypothetical protein [Nitrosomonas sp. wSCUT-2]
MCYGFGREADQSGGLLDDMFHPNKDKYPQQRIFVVLIGEWFFWFLMWKPKKKFFLKQSYPAERRPKYTLVTNDEKNKTG